MTTICKYCNEPENKQHRPGLICESCICFVHLMCLRSVGTPGDLACDVFFEFTCEDCSHNSKEIFTRSRFPWVNVVLLTLHHLSTKHLGISNHGYFHYKTHICSFIDRNWSILFEPQFKQKKNWVGTIAGTLSVHSGAVFVSGSAALGEAGWWRLQHAFSPAVAAHIIQELARDKSKGRRNQMAMDINVFIEKVTEMGYKDYIRFDTAEESEAGSEPAAKKRRADDYEDSALYYQLEMDNSQVQEEAAKEPSYSDAEASYQGFDFATFVPPSDSSSVHSMHQTHYYDSDSNSTPHEQEEAEVEKKPIELKPKKLEEKRELRTESLFSTKPNSFDLPWVIKEPYNNSKDLVELTQYEEVQLLKKVENLIPKVRDPNKKAYLCRFKAKLALRRLKRHKHLPIFDLERTAKMLSGQVSEDSRSVVNVDRVLDRFQRSYLMDNLCGTIADTNYGTLLLSHIEPTTSRSMFSGAQLKPFIRRDKDTSPLWLNVTDELLRKTNKHVPGYAPPPRGSVDYSYIRPQHVAAVNNLLAQFFWPGIDITEALEYPEFSCVVSYKRVVIGCAFLVPDARANEAYISFVLVRPEWRRAHVATFMLYHLLQTCTGKDVTLHVSPTNPAIFLYQKFGFKVEEFIQDFYEKYFDIEYTGCRHALFLRLVR